MRTLVVFAVALAIPATAFLYGQSATEGLAPYYPTPLKVVDRMLRLGGLKAGETMFDLGSGDGRIVIMAAQKFKAKSIGVEYNDSLARQSQQRIQELGLGNLARIIKGDLLQQNYESADLVTVYLLPVGNDLVTKLLDKQLRKGARVVAHDFEFTAWKPVKIEDVQDDGEGRSHRLYLYQHQPATDGK